MIDGIYNRGFFLEARSVILYAGRRIGNCSIIVLAVALVVAVVVVAVAAVVVVAVAKILDLVVTVIGN